MAIVSKQQILDSIKERFGDDTSDETLTLIEDISDTLTDYETKTNDTTNWKTKYEENDKAWRKKYKDRFYSSKTDDEEDDEGGEEPPKNLTYDELFKEETK